MTIVDKDRCDRSIKMLSSLVKIESRDFIPTLFNAKFVLDSTRNRL